MNIRNLIGCVVIIALICWGMPAMADDALHAFIQHRMEQYHTAKIVVIDGQEELYKGNSKKLTVNEHYFEILATYICDAAKNSSQPALKLTAMAELESGYMVTAKNGTCLGWFQIKPKFHEKAMIEQGFGQFADNPKGQCYYAAWKMDQGGSNQWEVWSRGTAKRLFKKLQGEFNAQNRNIGIPDGKDSA